MEEGTELMDRLRSNLHPDEHPAPLPMFTSCCPGWVGECFFLQGAPLLCGLCLSFQVCKLTRPGFSKFDAAGVLAALPASHAALSVCILGSHNAEPLHGGCFPWRFE